MSDGAPSGPSSDGAWQRIWRSLSGRTDGRRPVLWRVAVPVACACVGLLATTSMVNARGTDLRGGRSAELIDIVAAQRAEAEQLNDRIDQVQDDVTRLTEEVGGTRLRRLEDRIARLSVTAGLTGLEGPGITVTLDDAPQDEEPPENVDANRLVVHQQDIQAVANALWDGGAEGITIQDQRIISTTGIKCVGNTVLLQGVPYAPPYVIAAVGDPTRMYDALLRSAQVQAYRADALTYNLGWGLEESDSLELPAFTGTPDLDFARAAGN